MSQHVALNLCFTLCSRRVVGTSDVVGYSDCRQVCDDEESFLEDLESSFHVHEYHDDQPLFSIGYGRLSGQDSPFTLYTLFVFNVFFSLHGVAASSLVRLSDRMLASVVSPFVTKKRRKSICHLLLCQILPRRIACVLVNACACGTDRPRGGAPRSFRNFVSLRNLSHLLQSRVFVILWTFHNVDRFEYSSVLNCELQGST